RNTRTVIWTKEPASRKTRPGSTSVSSVVSAAVQSPQSVRAHARAHSARAPPQGKWDRDTISIVSCARLSAVAKSPLATAVDVSADDATEYAPQSWDLRVNIQAS